MDDCAPDSTTVCRFRNILLETDLYDDVLEEINRQLESAGVLVKRGTIVDASIMDISRRPRGRKEYEVVEERNEEAGMDISAGNKGVLKRVKFKSRIMHKGVRGCKLTEREQRINVATSKTKYKAKRTFGSIRRRFHGGIARYVGLAKSHAQHIMETIAYN